MAEMKRSIKDSVFTFLFKQPEYTLQLYQVLHPEDSNITAADLKLVTLENVLSTGFYNDLGFQVGNTVMVLTEAQSTFSENISLRFLMYLARTYQQYVEKEKLDLYSTKAIKIPRPELYVVYTGDKKDISKILRLSDLYDGEGSVDMTLQVLQRDGTGNIVDQYVRFCEIADEQRKKYGYTQQAINEAIRLCIEEGVLVLFLESRKKEVVDIMVILFDEAKIKEIHDYNVQLEAKLEMARNLKGMGFALESIAQASGLSLGEIQAL